MAMRWKTIGRKTAGGIFQYVNLDTQEKAWGHLYRDALGRRRRKMGFETKADAANDQKKELLKAPGAVEHRTFEDAKKAYVADRLAAGKEESSYSHLESWADVFKGKRVERITSEMIEARLMAWVEEKSLSDATRNRMLAVLSGMLSYCYRRKWISHHPTDHGRVPMLAEKNKRRKWLRAHEVEKLCEAAPDWLSVIIRFAVGTGMRLGEICTLRKTSYVEDDHGNAHAVVERPKNRKPLYYPLEGWPKTYMKNQVDALPFPGSFVFPGPGRIGRNGVRLPGNSARTAIKRALPKLVTACGFEYGRGEDNPDGITFHSFRHSMASIGLNAGLSVLQIQEMGNWKSRSMVERYAHVAPETMRKGAATIAALIAPGAAKTSAEKEEKKVRARRRA